MLFFPVLKISRVVATSFWKPLVCSASGFQLKDLSFPKISWNLFGISLTDYKMATTDGNAKCVVVPASVFQKIEKNNELAENMISEICDKIIEIEKMRSKQRSHNSEITNLREEVDRLNVEIFKWKQLLILRQIRNGRKYIRSPDSRPNIKSEGSAVNGVDAATVKSSNASEASSKSEKPKTSKSPAAVPEKSGESPGVANSNDSKQGKGKAKPKQDGEKVPAVKKEKVEGQGQPAATAEVVDVSRLDFRVGKIIQCERHPDAESLYMETVDVGEAKPRIVISGLVKHVPLEAMQNRLVILLCNLKPAKMRGITSEAMVMCASTPEKVEILVPPPGVVPGDIVDFEGFTRNPDAVLNPKKKIFETVAPDLMTNAEKVATYKGIPFTVKGKGVVVSETLPNVNIK